MGVHLGVLFSIIALSVLTLQNTRYDKRGMKRFIILSELILFIVIGCRGVSVGLDTITYKIYYNRLLWQPSFNKRLNWEPLFILFIRIAGAANNFQLLLILCAAVTCIGFGTFIYLNADDKWIAFWYLFFYITLNLYFNSLHLMRQICAMAVAINIYTILRKEKNWKGLLKAGFLVALAMGFHITTPIFTAPIIITMLLNKIGRKTIAFALLASSFAGLLLSYAQRIILLFERFSRYMNDDRLTEGRIGIYAASLIVIKIILTIIVLMKLDPNDERNDSIYRLTLINVVATTFFVLQSKTQFALRIGYWYEMYFPLYLPTCLHRIKKKNNRYLLILFFFLYGTAYFVYMMQFGGRKSNRGTVPYLFFWQ